VLKTIALTGAVDLHSAQMADALVHEEEFAAFLVGYGGASVDHQNLACERTSRNVNRDGL
jgi:hypothetical protein